MALLILIVALGLLLAVNLRVDALGRPLIRSAEEVEPRRAGLIFGAYALPDGRPSDALRDRLDTGLKLYRMGKFERFILSGDHGRQHYDEVNSMRRYLEEQGVPKEDLFLDHAGFDTYDSLYRAQQIFQVQELILVTQRFHLPRALYIGRSLGLECQGVEADIHPLQSLRKSQLREVVAKVKAMLEVNLGRKPVYLGDPIPIEGDACLSHDQPF